MVDSLSSKFKTQSSKLNINKIAELKKQVEELTNKWKRALADYQNLEKRLASEKDEFVRFSNAALIVDLLTVLDYLEQASLHLKDEGLALAVKQFKAVLQNAGVEEISVHEKKFDPKFMECVETVSGLENYVVEVMQKGYLLHKKVLRQPSCALQKGLNAVAF